MKMLMNRILWRRGQKLAALLKPYLPAQGRLLDVGSGTGHNAAAIEADFDLSVTEVDVVDMNAVGRPVELYDGKTLPFDNRSFDATMLLFVLHYAPDPAGLLRELHRVTAGRIFVMQSVYDGPVGRAVLWVREWLQGRFAFEVASRLGFVPRSPCSMKPLHYFTRESLAAIFQQAGLRVVARSASAWPGARLHRDFYVLEEEAALSEDRRTVDVSVIIPARNEEREISRTLDAVRQACAGVADQSVEIILVDNRSTDRTAEIVRQHEGVRYVACDGHRAPCARNHGARLASGEILVFVDADTRIPKHGLARIFELAATYRVGIFGIRGESGDWRSRCWWQFWNAVRRLPLPRAKALPAFMFCTRAAFEMYGPFDEEVGIGEEWPLTAMCYRHDPDRFIYDRSLQAVTSDRRMSQQPFGYTRTFCKYVWAILHQRGRVHYSDRIR